MIILCFALRLSCIIFRYDEMVSWLAVQKQCKQHNQCGQFEFKSQFFINQFFLVRVQVSELRIQVSLKPDAFRVLQEEKPKGLEVVHITSPHLVPLVKNLKMAELYEIFWFESATKINNKQIVHDLRFLCSRLTRKAVLDGGKVERHKQTSIDF